MNNFFDNQRIISLIWKRKFHFILVGIIAIVLSTIFSGPTFITPKFKSTARIYPSNIWALSEESETEQMLEILNSNDIKFKMFDAFELDKVYDISKEDSKYFTYMFAAYNENVKTSKTEYETAEIKVLDENPQRAADMCDSLITFYNHKVRSMHKIKDKEMVDLAKKQLTKRQNELKVYEHQLDSIREKYGIISYGNQVSEVTRGYMNALAAGRGSSSDTKKIQGIYKSFSEEGTKAIKIEKKFNKAVNEIDSLSTVYERHLMEYEKDITYCHVVESPFPADKKTSPVRWLIVLFATLSAVFFALLVFLVLDYKKQ